MNKFRQSVFVILLLGLAIFISFRNTQTFTLNNSNGIEYPAETSLAIDSNSASLEIKFIQLSLILIFLIAAQTQVLCPLPHLLL